jgi:hypothetical protein
MKSPVFRLFILFFCATATLLILQNAFDSSDHRKAEKAVRTYTVGGQVLGQLVESKAPGGVWSTEITQGCRGVVRTRYDAPGGHYEFDYDVPAHMIHPGNELARELMGALPAAVRDGGTSRDGMP